MRKSVAEFEVVTAGDEGAAYRWATLAFFGGMLVVWVLDKVGLGAEIVLLGLALHCAQSHRVSSAVRRSACKLPPALSPPRCPRRSPALQIVHALAHLADRHSRRKGKGKPPAGSVSTANLLAHEDASSKGRGPRGSSKHSLAATAPLPAAMEKRSSSGGVAGAKAEGGATPAAAAAAGLDLEAGPGGSPRQHHAPGAPAAEESGSSSQSESGGSAYSAELSGPGPLVEPCDSMTGAIVAATSPDVVEPEPSPRGDAAAAGEAAGTTSRTPPAVVQIMESDHHSFMLRKMGARRVGVVWLCLGGWGCPQRKVPCKCGHNTPCLNCCSPRLPPEDH